MRHFSLRTAYGMNMMLVALFFTSIWNGSGAIIEACAAVKCPFNHVCTVNANSTAVCRCNVKCTGVDKIIGPICARNGKTYKTACLMKKDQCKEKKAIRVYHYGNCIQQDSCADALPEICNDLRRAGLCFASVELMQFYCPISCRLCRQPAPHPQCHFSEHGCCWNTDMFATGPNQKGCDACTERAFCVHFKSLCSKERNIAVMRQFCPKTCGYC